MTQELELKLVAKFPELCKRYGGNILETCFHYGFEFGDAWYGLMEETLEQLEKVRIESGQRIEVEQAKVKFGRFVVYLDYDEDIPKDVRDKIYNITHTAYLKTI